MIIGTAGHIDHGKTALVRALTGIDTDRLPEEKRRGMTIDLGFAYRALPTTGGAPCGRTLGFVDVPGHERFVHNMLAGATGIDFVLLVVAADDGPMPQTREHLDIVSLLGVERGVVALTKADLVSRDRLAEAAGEVRALLGGSPLQNSTIVPLSSLTGDGIDVLADHLTGAARAMGARPPRGEFRMAIDRSLVLPGVGVVVTGTVAAGRIAVGERGMLTPSGIGVRIRSIHAHNRPAPCAQVGERCALNLGGAQVERERVRRGDWLVAPSLHAPRTRIDARLRLLHPGAQPPRAGVIVHLHLGAARVEARLMPLMPLGAGPLAPGAEWPARLVLEHPIGAWRGDRFIVRDASASRTIGGGVVLDPDPPARGGSLAGRLAALAVLDQTQPDIALAELLGVSPAGADLDRFALAGGLSPTQMEDARRAARARVLKAEAHRHGFALSPSHFAALRQDTLAALAVHHRAAPESPGPSPEQLRLALTPRLTPALFAALLKALADEGVLATSGASNSPSRSPHSLTAVGCTTLGADPPAVR